MFPAKERWKWCLGEPNLARPSLQAHRYEGFAWVSLLDLTPFGKLDRLLRRTAPLARNESGATNHVITHKLPL